MFIYLDESGDLGFDWAKAGTSRYFTITILICKNKASADKVRQAVKRTLKNKVNHKRRGRCCKELKGTSITHAIKSYFYNQLPSDGFAIFSVTLNKRRVQPHLQTKAGKKKLYNFLARFLIEKTPLSRTQAGQVNLVLDKCKNKEEIKDFNQYIESQIEGVLPLNTPLYITHESSEENYCLQAVDLFCWGLARKYTGDKAWHDIFKSRVKYDSVYLR